MPEPTQQHDPTEGEHVVRVRKKRRKDGTHGYPGAKKKKKRREWKLKDVLFTIGIILVVLGVCVGLLFVIFTPPGG